MEFTAENILLLGAVLVFCSILVSKTGYRFGIPVLLLFLLTGMLFGSDGLGVKFENAGQAQFIGMIALSIILFSGGMDTKFQEIRPILLPGILLSTAGVLLTTVLTGAFIFFISLWGGFGIHMSLTLAMLLAATMSSTDSASVFNILRSQNLNLKHNLRPLLELESGSNDPMAYMLTIVLIQIIGAEGATAGQIAADFAVQFIFGGIAGFGIGKFAVWIINKINLSSSALYPILLLSVVFFLFTITDLLNGNGYLAVYIAGIIVGNSKIVNRKETVNFFEGLTWLFQIVMFLSLGLLVNPHELLGIAPAALLIGTFMIFAARPLSVIVCLLPFRNLTSRARIFISWVGLRGAVPIIFATYPVVEKIDGADQIFNIVFFITLVSLILQGTTITWMAKKLKLALPAKKEGNEFGVELPDEIDSSLKDMTVTEEMLATGNRLSEMSIPTGTLVMIIKRGDEFIVPNGSMVLYPGDKLLLISDSRHNNAKAGQKSSQRQK